MDPLVVVIVSKRQEFVLEVNGVPKQGLIVNSEGASLTTMILETVVDRFIPQISD